MDGGKDIKIRVVGHQQAQLGLKFSARQDNSHNP